MAVDAVEGLGDHRRSREREQLVFGADEDPRGITLARAVEQSGDLLLALEIVEQVAHTLQIGGGGIVNQPRLPTHDQHRATVAILAPRSEEHTSELQSLMRISYAVFCLK